MTESPEARASRLLARSIALDPPWEGTPACWSWSPEQTDPASVTAGLSSAALAAIRQAEGGEETLLLDCWQAGRCAICGRHTAGELITDHDHGTGLVRGLLCRSCNTREGNDQRPVGMLGKYRERPPAAILGIRVRYFDPYIGEYAQPRAIAEGDRWEKNPVVGP